MERQLGIPHPLRTAVACLLLPLHLASCTAWRVQPAPAQEVVARAPDRARLTLTTGSIVTVEYPRIDADIVRGVNEATGDSMAVPLAQVSRIETPHVSTWRTLGLIVGIPVGSVVVLFAVLGIYCGTNPGACDMS